MTFTISDRSKANDRLPPLGLRPPYENFESHHAISELSTDHQIREGLGQYWMTDCSTASGMKSDYVVYARGFTESSAKQSRFGDDTPIITWVVSRPSSRSVASNYGADCILGNLFSGNAKNPFVAAHRDLQDSYLLVRTFENAQVVDLIDQHHSAFGRVYCATPNHQSVQMENAEASLYIARLLSTYTTSGESVALQSVFDFGFALRQKKNYQLFDNTLRIAKIEKLSPKIMLAFLTITAPIKEVLKHRRAFFDNVKTSLISKYGADRTNNMLIGLD